MLQINSHSGERSSGLGRHQFITIANLESFKFAILEEKKVILQASPTQSTKQWLKSIEVRKMLSTFAGTLHHLQVNGTLLYTKLGGIALYEFHDIESVLSTQSSK